MMFRSEEARSVGFIGLGNMGGRMTRVLVRAGYTVYGYDAVLGRARACGAEPVTDIRSVVEAAPHDYLSLPDSRVVEQVMTGEDGVLPYVRPGQVVVDFTTADPASSQTLQRRMNRAGAQFIDAGVSGGAAAAEAGRLTLMVGGDGAAIAQVRPTLSLLAADIYEMGGPGAGHTTKLLNNFLNAVNLAASSEVLVAAAVAGLDVTRVLQVINASSGSNWATRNRFPSIVNGDYLEGGLTSKLMLKDLMVYLRHLGRLGAPTLNASGPLACFGAAVHAGYGDQISNRVVDALGDLAGGVRLHRSSTGAVVNGSPLEQRMDSDDRT